MNTASTSKEQETTETSQGRSRGRRAIAIAVLALALTGASMGLGANAASASTNDGRLGCTSFPGRDGSVVRMDLSDSRVGTTVGIYLYRAVNGQWVYQNQMDWAKVGSDGRWYWEGGWQQSNQLLLVGRTAGAYILTINYWNAAGTYLGGGFTHNYCNYTT